MKKRMITLLSGAITLVAITVIVNQFAFAVSEKDRTFLYGKDGELVTIVTDADGDAWVVSRTKTDTGILADGVDINTNQGVPVKVADTPAPTVMPSGS